tara:strand:+ start:452 stop:697 length:246 start_codon:yes stop_codon:yes gene_type:complete
MAINKEMEVLIDQLRANDQSTWIDLLYESLSCYRDDCISGEEFNEEWDAICTVMAWIKEELFDDNNPFHNVLDSRQKEVEK